MAISTVISSGVGGVGPFTNVAAPYQTQNPRSATIDEAKPFVHNYIPTNANANNEFLKFLDDHSQVIDSRLAQFQNKEYNTDEEINQGFREIVGEVNSLYRLDITESRLTPKFIDSRLAQFQNKEYNTDEEINQGFREIVGAVSTFQDTDYNKSIRSKLTEYMTAILRSDKAIQGTEVSAAIHQAIRDFHQEIKKKSSSYIRMKFAVVLENIYRISRGAKLIGDRLSEGDIVAR